MKLYLRPGKQIYIGKINTSEIELRDLVKAWLAISFAFAMVLRHGIGLSFYQVFIISAVTVGTGFLLHELGHKFVAQRYGCFAEFRSFDQMLILAVFMSFFGFVFAAPGAVMIAGKVDKVKNGIISAAGPIINIVLALLFLSISFMFPGGMLKILAFYGYFINSWLALFNMIPVWNLDGAKVLKWNKKIYGVIVAVALLLLFLQNFISI
jgi:Zn-dependent protease